MAPHVDILDETESLRKPFLGSAALHGALLATILLSQLIHPGRREPWGDPNSLGGGSIGINVVSQVPLPSRGGIVNPVANDTESQVPQPPPKPDARAERRSQEPDPDAIALKSKRMPRRMAEVVGSRQRYRRPETGSNQLYSAGGSALVSPMVGLTGSGGIGVGTGSPFGSRFGWYVDVLKQRVAEKWKTGDIDPRLQTAPPVIVTFTILRDGTVRNVRIVQRSGNAALDYSAQRAIYEASPFPALPPGFERNDANIEFWFQLKR